MRAGRVVGELLMVATALAPHLLQLRDLAVGYGDRPAVSGVDLDVDPGDVVAVLGHNGSGKSTLVKGILGLAQIYDGDLESIDRREIGYVPQHHSLGAGVSGTVREVVATGMLAHRPWWKPLTRETRGPLLEAIAAVGLTEHARCDVGSLSGGQQRRVLIARALVGQPRLLVMDEPTAGVDLENQLALASTIQELAGQGIAVVIVTHEVGPLVGIVTKALLLRGGRVAYRGDPAGLDLIHHDGHHDHAPPRPAWAPAPDLPPRAAPTSHH